MKINFKELAEYSSGEAVIEGRLDHKKITGSFSQSGFKDRWFKLRANILFYFNSNETGKTYEKKPSGAFVLENAIVKHEIHSEVPFAFSILFRDEIEKKHLFSGRSNECIIQWVHFLEQASYEFWRSRLTMLQTKLSMLTGKDPLLMYPRNEGITANSNADANIPEKLEKRPCPTFRSYVTENGWQENSKKVPVGSFFKLDEESVVNTLDEIGNGIKGVQIVPPPVPPKRPARINRIKGNSSSPNLIDL